MKAPHFSDPCWVAWMEAVSVSPVPSIGLGVRAGSLWASRATGRRGCIVWSQDGKVCLSFNDQRNGRIIINQSTLIKRYIETK